MACARAIHAPLAPCSAPDAWRLTNLYAHAAALEEVLVEAAPRGFEALQPESATGAQVLALVQEDSLVAKSEEAVWWEGRQAARGCRCSRR